MAKVVNLRTAKKSRARAEDRRAGDANAARFGQTKAGKSAAETTASRLSAHLDAHKRDR